MVWGPCGMSRERETSGVLLPRGVLHKFLYGEALPQGLTPCLEKGTQTPPPPSSSMYVLLHEELSFS